MFYLIDLVEEFPGRNAINISSQFLERGNGLISIKGEGNRITIHEPHHVAHFHMTVNGGATVLLEPFLTLGDGQAYHLIAPGSLRIGEWSSFSSRVEINMHESGNIDIGERCLFANDVSIATSTVHKIFDLASGERINMPGDIKIGDHVWVATRATIWGGADVGGGSVVGHGSYVSKTFPENSLIAGNPARVVREGIRWEN